MKKLTGQMFGMHRIKVIKQTNKTSISLRFKYLFTNDLNSSSIVVTTVSTIVNCESIPSINIIRKNKTAQIGDGFMLRIASGKTFYFFESLI